MKNFDTESLDYFSMGQDVNGYNFIDGRITEYRHTYLNTMTDAEIISCSGVSRQKSDWTTLKAHEFASKNNVRIVKTQERKRMSSY